MIIGDPSSFAIRCEFTGKFDNWLFGRLCYLVGSEQIGDYECKTSLEVLSHESYCG